MLKTSINLLDCPSKARTCLKDSRLQVSKTKRKGSLASMKGFTKGGGGGNTVKIDLILPNTVINSYYIIANKVMRSYYKR
jgi:hypothetical protein